MLIYDELRESGKVPRVHGNGFLQLDLNEDGSKRLHIWDDALPRQSTKSSIHDHVFELKSHIICGRLIHVEFQAETVLGKSSDLYNVYKAERVEGSNNTILGWTGQTVRLNETRRFLFTAGSTYNFPEYELHDSYHEGFTATIMKKIDAPGDYGRPRVLVPYGQEPDNDFDREGFDPEELWPFVKKACDIYGLY